MPLKDAKKRIYNKKYYTDNKERISEKKERKVVIWRDMHYDLCQIEASYNKDPDSGAKSTARLKASIKL